MATARIGEWARKWVPITLRDMLVFSGRSRRWEAAGYMFLFSICVNFPVLIAGDKTNPLRIALGMCVGLLWWLPYFALFVRRMHDQNRTARWVLLPVAETFLAASLLMLPGTGSNLKITLLIWDNRPGWAGVSGALCTVALLLLLTEMILLFWPGTSGPNRYGADPRLDRPTQRDAIATS